MTKFKWYTYQYGTKLIEDPDNFETINLGYGPVLIANCLNKNGYYGACCIIMTPNGFMLEAANDDTGKPWKSPNDVYSTVMEAVNVAESVWRPI